MQFRNLTGGTVAAAGGTLSITVEAVKKGSAGNVGNGAITVLVTPLAGVTSSNVLISTGEDPELDAALRLRNSTKWARLSVELVRDAYINIALEASASIRRAEVNDTNPRGPGTIDVYIAGDSGIVGSEEIAAAQNAFAAVGTHTKSYPVDDTIYPLNPDPTRVLVLPADAAPIDFEGVVYFGSTYSAAATQLQVEAAIRAYITLAPIGGYPYPSPGSVIPKNNIEHAIMAVPGVRTVNLALPSADVPVGGFSVATVRTIALTYSKVE